MIYIYYKMIFFSQSEDKLLKIFQATLKSQKVDPKLVANVLINDFLTVIHKEKLDLELVFNQINGEYFSELIGLVQNETINRNTAKMVLKEVVLGNVDSPSKVILFI